MAITLGTNIASYRSRLELDKSSNKLDSVLERLSTGSRINRAGDDAAGLVISQNMEAQIRSSKQAMKNIQTANSFLTVTEDSMVAVSDHIQRINDLLTNMANDTNDETSRTAAVEEIIERLDEINRLANSTNFNGKEMLSGKTKPIYVQMGPDKDDTSVLDISPALSDCHTKALGIILPGNLDPRAKFSSDGKVLIPMPDDPTKYMLETEAYKDEPAEYTGTIDETKKPFDPTNYNCRQYMEKIQTAVDKLASNRGLIGAYENRLQSSYDAMTSRIESLEEAKVPYTDTDVAAESSEMVRRQILQQINVSVLAQSNTSPQLALSLLS